MVHKRLFSTWMGAAAFLLAFTPVCEAVSTTAEANGEQAQAAAEVSVSAGDADYKTHCQACHQADGKGLPGAFPPLADNDHIIGDSDYLISNILTGLSGELVVNDVTYNGVMPPMSYLTNQEVADIILYVIHTWGDSADAVTVERVPEQRVDLGLEDRTEGERHSGASDDELAF